MLARKERAGLAVRVRSGSAGLHRPSARSVLWRAAAGCVERLEARQLLSTVVPAAAPQLASEGPVEVDLRASDLTAGDVNTWNNNGAAGGSFAPWGTAAPAAAAAAD